MRLWSPGQDAFRDHGQQLTRKLPGQPAAVPLYVHGRARVLALDFDAKQVGRDIVEDDVRRCVEWVHGCGGRTIVDRSTSGGQHVLVPLPIGTTVGRPDIEPVLRMLAAQLPSLDVTPMLNPSTGCITPPGSRCREGGYRQLAGALGDAVDALTVGSDAGFLGRLPTALNLEAPRASSASSPKGPDGVRAVCTTPSSAASANTGELAQRWEGGGDHARLRAQYRRSSPIPRAVRAFAVDGIAPAGRWRARDGRVDRSAARQAVLAAAALRGLSLADIRSYLPAAGGDWAGFDAAYHRYGRGADAALRRDWAKACDWVVQNAPKFLSSAHKTQEHTGGWWGEPSRAAKQTTWLAAATMWADAQWPGSPRRHTILALLQGLAHASVVTGGLVRGVPVVEIGGRSLSLMSCLTETTVWQILRDLRDLPGSPILRTRRGAGIVADAYALVTPTVKRRRIRPDPIHIERARVETVHEAWSVLGLHCRKLYELITHHGLTTPADAITAARMSRASGYAALTILTTAGLLIHQHGRITTGPVHLDSIATAYGLPQARRERIERHRLQRTTWHDWLHNRFSLHTTPPADLSPASGYDAAPSGRQHTDARNRPQMPDDASGATTPPDRITGQTPSHIACTHSAPI